eukprot:5269833-Amphidinium_carterae.2
MQLHTRSGSKVHSSTFAMPGTIHHSGTSKPKKLLEAIRSATQRQTPIQGACKKGSLVCFFFLARSPVESFARLAR